MPQSFAARVRAALSPRERILFRRLNSPERIQDFLDSVPTNFEPDGPTNLSPRLLLSQNRAHCFEAAVFAAAVLGFHGARPLLMDFATGFDDEDHTIAVFLRDGLYGAISKTNHAVIKYRDAIYRTPRELAMSYAHEYYLHDGRKSLRGYSALFDLSRFAPEKWVTSGESLDWLMDSLSRSRYLEIAPDSAMRRLRRASRIELESLAIVEWQDPRKASR